MERVGSRGISMRIGRSAGANRAGLATESFRSINTGETLRLGAFTPERPKVSLEKASPKGSFFERTVPMLVPTPEFKPVTDPKPAPIRIVSSRRFGEFTPKPPEITDKKVENYHSRTLVDFTTPVKETKPVSLVKETPADTSPGLLWLEQKPQPEQPTVIAKKISLVRTELKKLEESQPQQAVNQKTKPVSLIKPEPLKILQGEELEEKVVQMVATKGETVTKVWLATQGHSESVLQSSLQRKPIDQQKHSPITIGQELVQKTKQKVKEVGTSLALKIKKQPIILLPEQKKTEEPKEKKMKFIIDEDVRWARFKLAMGNLFGKLLFGQNPDNEYSGKDIALPEEPTDELVSGLVKKIGGKVDATWDILVGKINNLPKTKLGSLFGIVFKEIDAVPPVDVQFSEKVKGEKEAPTSIVALLLGTVDLTSPK